MNWNQIYQRQVARAYLVPDWLEALELKRGAHVLDVGACTGYVSLLLAERVGPEGHVYAIDRAAEALEYMEQLQKEQGVRHITRIVADAAEVHTLGVRGEAALATLLLHIVDEPRAVLHSIAQVLEPGGRLIVAEFHPDGPCLEGAKRERRISPSVLEQWCLEAGFAVLETRRQGPEHYMVVVQLSGQ